MGITDNAQNKLGDITFLELPDEGAFFNAGDSLGEIESPKAVSEIYAPTDMTVGNQSYLKYLFNSNFCDIFNGFHLLTWYDIKFL